MNPPRAWPTGIPHTVEFPRQTLTDNLIASANRVPDRSALIFYGAEYTYSQMLALVEQLSGHFQIKLSLVRGEPVLLYMQNSPQFIISYYAILHAGGVVVPINPMSKDSEVAFIQSDTNARVMLCGSEVCEYALPLLVSRNLEQIIVANYGDMCDPCYDLKPPKSMVARNLDVMRDAGFKIWQDVIHTSFPASPAKCDYDDLAVIPYSSGTTGNPKGCMHSHATVMATAVGGVIWHAFEEHSISLATLPMFHVTGMQGAMNGPIYAGGTLVIMVRWDREIAAELIRRYEITRWRSISTMAIDLVNDPNLENYDLHSLRAIGGGGAAMPAPIAHRLKDMTGLDYLEGYGLTETMAATHLNPPDAPRAQCLGIPVFGVTSCIWSPEIGKCLAPDEVGEILISGPQIFLGYWKRPEATTEAFVTLEGIEYFRTGDIGYVDKDGFFYMVDRLKRMINASGFKVWPAEVEAMMHAHPEIDEACIIATKDARKGEAVKAIIVVRDPKNPPDTQEIKEWCRSNMATYKAPTVIEYVETLPKSGSGKVMWRTLTMAEFAKFAADPPPN